MPAIQIEQRVLIQGAQAPILVKRSSLQVGSWEQFSLSVDAVPPAKVAKARANKKAATDKKEKRVMKATYRPQLANVRFVAIFDNGQAGGLRVKVGKAKFAALGQPLVFMERAASGFGSRPTIILENESNLPRTALMVVGSDLPKGVRKIELVKRLVPVAKTSTAKQSSGR